MKKSVSILKALIREPLRGPRFVAQKIMLAWLRSRPNIDIGKNVKLVGFPIIDIHPQGKLTIEGPARLYSRNRDYFLNLFAPVKLVVDRPGAEIVIGKHCGLHGVCLHASQKITIGNHVMIAANVQIFDSHSHNLNFDDLDKRRLNDDVPEPVMIEDYAWIGTGAIILPGVTIGRGSVIAAGSIVTKSIPPMVVAGGNPARVIKDYRGFNRAAA